MRPWAVGAAAVAVVALIARRASAASASEASSGDNAASYPADQGASLALVAPAVGGGAEVPVYQTGEGAICYRSRFSIDTDGAGDPHGDATHQPEVAWGGRGIDADRVAYIVLVPQIYQPLAIGLGCLGVAVNLQTGQVVGCVVADRGGRGNHAGEGSPAAAAAIGLPRYRGTSQSTIGWWILPSSGNSAALAPDYQEQAVAEFELWGGIDRLRAIVGEA